MAIETKYSLQQFQSGVLDSSGSLSVTFKNPGPNQRWIIRRISINVATGKMTTCTVYRGPLSANQQLDFTRKGNGDTSETEIILYPSEFITVAWTGGAVGAIASCRIEGDIMVSGNRSYGV